MFFNICSQFRNSSVENKSHVQSNSEKLDQLLIGIDDDALKALKGRLKELQGGKHSFREIQKGTHLLNDQSEILVLVASKSFVPRNVRFWLKTHLPQMLSHWLFGINFDKPLSDRNTKNLLDYIDKKINISLQEYDSDENHEQVNDFNEINLCNHSLNDKQLIYDPVENCNTLVKLEEEKMIPKSGNSLHESSEAGISDSEKLNVDLGINSVEKQNNIIGEVKIEQQEIKKNIEAVDEIIESHDQSIDKKNHISLYEYYADENNEQIYEFNKINLCNHSLNDKQLIYDPVENCNTLVKLEEGINSVEKQNNIIEEVKLEQKEIKENIEQLAQLCKQDKQQMDFYIEEMYEQNKKERDLYIEQLHEQNKKEMHLYIEQLIKQNVKKNALTFEQMQEHSKVILADMLKEYFPQGQGQNNPEGNAERR